MSKSIIVGAGWSGLMCAYTLSKAGHDVTLIEAAPQIGGRARAVSFADNRVDNGQHLFMGAYHTLREVLSALGLDQNQLFQILPMELFLHCKQPIQLRLVNFPAPLNLLCGLILAKNLPIRAKLDAIKFCFQLRAINFQLKQDCTLAELFKNYHQSDFIIKHLWEPIALAAMTSNIHVASAQIFLNVLKSCFAGSKSDSNWYLPTTDLSAIFPQHIEQFLKNNGNKIICGQAVKNLKLDANNCIAVHGIRDSWSADHVVLAIPPWQVVDLIQPHPILTNCSEKLSKFTYEPITTVYFEFAQPVNLPYPLLGAIGTTSQWVFDRTFSKQPHIISVVISGSGPHEKLCQNELANIILQELQAMAPHLDTPLKHRIIREKRAAFCCDVAIQQHRPTPQTNVKNLWLTGDYLQNGLPATLEGALISGKQTAMEILERVTD